VSLRVVKRKVLKSEGKGREEKRERKLREIGRFSKKCGESSKFERNSIIGVSNRNPRELERKVNVN